MRTDVLSTGQQLLTAAIARHELPSRLLAERIGIPEAELLLELHELQAAGLVCLPSGFYAEGRIPEGGGHVRLARGAATRIHAGDAASTVRRRLIAKYRCREDTRDRPEAELRQDLRDALLLCAATDDPGVVGSIQGWLGMTLREGIPGLNGPSR